MGNNSRIIIQGDTIYQISGTCLEGWHVDEWFKKLCNLLLKEKQAEKNTIIDTDCGGGFKLK